MRLKTKNSKNLEIMNREQLFNNLISENVVSVEAFKPYKKSLSILLKDYFCTDEVYIITVGGYGTHFYIPGNNDPVEAIRNEVYEDEFIGMNDKAESIQYRLNTTVFWVKNL